MKPTFRQFMDALFEPNEQVCIAKYPYGTSLISVGTAMLALQYGQYICINPLKESRKDINVTAFRNILIEMDSIPLILQKEFIEKIGLPYTTQVYSGGKSYHFIISLREPFPTKAAYDIFVKRLYRAINAIQPNTIDMSVKNASRFTRLPFVIREGKGQLQELIEVRLRVPFQELEAWIIKHLPAEPERKIIAFPMFSKSSGGRLNAFTRNFLMGGAVEGQANNQLFMAAVDFCRCQYPIEDAEEKLLAAIPLMCPTRAKRTIQSAYQNETARQQQELDENEGMQNV